MRLAYYDERVIERMADVSGVDGGMTVADVGTGTGFVAAGLAPRVRRVIGIDNAPAMLEVARENLRALGVCGPGRYGDKVPSTPLRVLGSAVKHPVLKDMLVSIFNDVDPEHVHSLQEAIDSNPELEQLKHKPLLWNYQVGNALVEQLEG
jgi:tRNA A58 N-methylase Trm61